MPNADPWVDRILRVVDHIHGHLDQEIAPEALARIAALSLHHFHRVFRGMTGESVMGFVRRLRLERAAQRLKFGSESVTTVALNTGYGSHEAFTRAFRARFGAAPSAYREDKRSDADLHSDVVIRDEPVRRCVSFRVVGDYAVCERAWAELAAAGMLEQLEGMPLLGLVYDDPDITRAEQLRYDACIVLPDGARPPVVPDGCVLRSVPAGRYAVAVHRGSYETILSTYVALLGRWLPHRGVELSDDPVVEVYLEGPEGTAPQDLVTEICVRIE